MLTNTHDFTGLSMEQLKDLRAVVADRSFTQAFLEAAIDKQYRTQWARNLENFEKRVFASKSR